MRVFSKFFNDKKSKPKFYTLAGEATFSVDVQITGDPPYSTCILSVNAFNDLNKRIAIASKFTWYRVYKKAKMKVHASGNTYHASSLDIGAKIMVEIEPIEEGDCGTAYVEFGPFELDPGMKKTLQGIMRTGGTRFVLDDIQSVINQIDESGHNTRRSGRMSFGGRKSSTRGHFVLFKKSFKITNGNFEDRSHNKSSSFRQSVNLSKSMGNELKVGLMESFEVESGPGPKAVTILFRGKETELRRLLGMNYNDPVGNKLMCQLISKSARDILIMALRCFQSKLDLEDSMIFTQAKKRLHEEMSEDKKSTIDLVTINNGVSREIEFLFGRNTKLERENERLKGIVRNLEGELSRTVNFSLNHGQNSRSSNSRDEPGNKIQPILEDDEFLKVKDEKEMKKAKMKVAELEIENQDLRKKILRLNDNIKKMRYKEMMESKLNITTENYSKEIKGLENTLQKYAKDNKRLVKELSRKQENFDHSLIKTNLDGERKLLEAEQRNAKLMKELITYKNKVKKFEEMRRTMMGTTHGTLNLNYEQELPFRAEESRIEPQNSMLRGSIRGMKNHNSIELSKLLDEDISIIQANPEQSLFGNISNLGNVKYRALKEDYESLIIENKNLIRQVQILRSELKNSEDNQSVNNLIKKFKSENNEIRKLAEKLQKKNSSLIKEKNELKFKVNDLKRENDKLKRAKENEEFNRSFMGFESNNKGDNSQKVMDLEFKVSTLENVNKDLMNEIKALKNMGGMKKNPVDLQNKIKKLKEENSRLKNQTEGNESQVVLELKRKIKLLEENQSDQEKDNEEASKKAYENLMKTNERLMQEIIRLNLKQGNDSSMYESVLSQSGFMT